MKKRIVRRVLLATVVAFLDALESLNDRCFSLLMQWNTEAGESPVNPTEGKR